MKALLLQDLIFKIRFSLMPEQLKHGSWLVFDGMFMNIDDCWKEDKKKKVWYIPKIQAKFRP